jgi:hypothetical protein
VTPILELVPIDADVNEAEYVAHEDRPKRQQCPEIAIVRDFEFQCHDGNDVAMTPSLKASKGSCPSVFSPGGIPLPYP